MCPPATCELKLWVEHRNHISESRLEQVMEALFERIPVKELTRVICREYALVEPSWQLSYSDNRIERCYPLWYLLYGSKLFNNHDVTHVKTLDLQLIPPGRDGPPVDTSVTLEELRYSEGVTWAFLHELNVNDILERLTDFFARNKSISYDDSRRTILASQLWNHIQHCRQHVLPSRLSSPTRQEIRFIFQFYLDGN